MPSKYLICLLALACFTPACEQPHDVIQLPSTTPSSLQARDGDYLTQGSFDIGAESLVVNGVADRLPQVCDLAVYYRPLQYLTHMGGRYPTLFFLFKDVFPHENPDHYIFESDFQLEFLTDEPCGDYFDLLDYYTGTWDDQHAFLAAVLHPHTADCWTEGTFFFSIASNFPMTCPNGDDLPLPYSVAKQKTLPFFTLFSLFSPLFAIDRFLVHI